MMHYLILVQPNPTQPNQTQKFIIQLNQTQKSIIQVNQTQKSIIQLLNVQSRHPIYAACLC